MLWRLGTENYLRNKEKTNKILFQIELNMLENLNVKQSTKCVFYDKGYCKLKFNCLQKHPSIDCDNNCNDKTTCPKRHRVLCKNGDSCVFIASKSCEFCHTVKSDNEVDNTLTENLSSYINEINAKVQHIENKLMSLKKFQKQTEDKIAVIVNKLEKTKQTEQSVGVLETQIVELKSEVQKLKTSMSKSVTCLEERMCGLDNLTMKDQSQGTLTSSLEDLDNGELKCTHCQKEFKTKSNLQIHVKKSLTA